jgi:hypothetical protein
VLAQGSSTSHRPKPLSPASCPGPGRLLQQSWISCAQHPASTRQGSTAHQVVREAPVGQRPVPGGVDPQQVLVVVGEVRVCGW